MMNKHFFLHSRYFNDETRAIVADVFGRHKIDYLINEPDSDGMVMVQYSAEDYQVNVLISMLFYDIFSLTNKINNNGFD
jgi:hypothetical protein